MEVVETTKPVKKIKLVISDLHLGKGKILQGGGLNWLEEFYYQEKLSRAARAMRATLTNIEVEEIMNTNPSAKLKKAE